MESVRINGIGTDFPKISGQTHQRGLSNDGLVNEKPLFALIALLIEVPIGPFVGGLGVFVYLVIISGEIRTVYLLHYFLFFAFIIGAPIAALSSIGLIVMLHFFRSLSPMFAGFIGGFVCIALHNMIPLQQMISISAEASSGTTTNFIVSGPIFAIGFVAAATCYLIATKFSTTN